MIFIGAGLPVAFGIPALSQMTSNVMEYVKSDANDLKQIELVIKALEKKGFATDIENVLTVLESIKDPAKVYQEIGPKVAAFDNESMIEKVTDVDVLVSKIKQRIKELCSYAEYEKACDFYTYLLRKTIKIKSIRGSPEQAQMLNGLIVTTNYDITIEESLQRLKYALYDGFSYNSQRTELTFNNNWPEVSGANVLFVKLHGSIDYYKEQDGTIVRDRSTGRLGPPRKREDILVYPAGEKSITSTPFYDLYTKFRSELFKRKTALVLGFSFRDFALRNIFTDWLKQTVEATLVLYSRSASKTVDLFPIDVRPKIVAKNVDFNDKTCLDGLKDDFPV